MTSIEIPHGGIPNLKSAHEFCDFLKHRNRVYGLPFEYTRCVDEAAWLESRKGHIGASSAGCVLGLTEEWKPRRTYWEECRGLRKDEFMGNDLTEFGHRGEPLIRATWALEHPDFDVYDCTNIHFVSKARPWQATSLDMVMVHRDSGRVYIGEIKTALWSNGKWGEFAPDGYFAQVCHELDVTGFDGAAIVGRIRFHQMSLNDSGRDKVYAYEAEDAAVQDNIKFVRKAEDKFWASVESGVYAPILNLGL